MAPGMQLERAATGKSGAADEAQMGTNLGQVLLRMGNQLMLSSKLERAAGAQKGRGMLADMSPALSCRE